MKTLDVNGVVFTMYQNNIHRAKIESKIKLENSYGVETTYNLVTPFTGKCFKSIKEENIFETIDELLNNLKNNIKI